MSAAEYTIGEVAAMIGFSPHTLRAWERRHNILRPRRTASGQRRYTVEDIELLREVVNGVAVRGLTLKVAVQAARGLLALPAVEHRSQAAATSVGDGRLQQVDLTWRSVADFLPYLIAILDAEGKIVDANVVLAHGAGTVRERLPGRSFVDFVEPYDRAKAVAAFRPPFRRRRGWELTLRLRRQAGFFSFDCLPIVKDGRELLIVIGRDLGHGDGSNLDRVSA
ncbi:MAG TPA: MerR family transcriptional regulator [Candidatus Dormibacteraeota bacterium]|nr:MerR family transcriptional regulator [Candidatus Dormibacteraeota bacterium]